MKTLRTISIVLICCLASCATQRAEIASWWKNPATQKVVSLIEQQAIVFAEQAGLNAVQQWVNTGKVDTDAMLVQAGANTISSTAAQIRALQGTKQVADPIAIAAALESNGYTEQTARIIAGQLATNIANLANKTGNANAANETTASGLDKAVVDLTPKS